MNTYTLEQFKKFAIEIEAYENGESIEVCDGDEWVQLYHPYFDASFNYRVKPKLSREEITANWVKENNVKIGDRVRVLKGFETEEFGIVKGESDRVVGKIGVVDKVKLNSIYIETYNSLWMLPVECLEKVKEEYVPFTLEDRALFMGKVVKRKQYEGFYIVTYANEERVGLDGYCLTYQDALKCYEFEDGKPFGKLKL